MGGTELGLGLIGLAEYDLNTFAFGQYQDATSKHPGGVNGTLGDGSVRFMKDTINLETWWALGTRSGEVLSADSS